MKRHETAVQPVQLNIGFLNRKYKSSATRCSIFDVGDVHTIFFLLFIFVIVALGLIEMQATCTFVVVSVGIVTELAC